MFGDLNRKGVALLQRAILGLFPTGQFRVRKLRNVATCEDEESSWVGTRQLPVKISRHVTVAISGVESLGRQRRDLGEGTTKRFGGR